MKSFILVLMLLAGLAHAGKEAGGGNAVVCFTDEKIPPLIREKYGNMIPDEFIADGKKVLTDKIYLIEAVDLYLAKKEKGLQDPVTPDIIPEIPGENYLQFVERAALRYDQTFPGLSDMFRKGVKRFPKSRITREGKGVPYTPDSALVGQIDTEHCVIATMAFQYNTSQYIGLETDYYLHVDSRLFNHRLHTLLSQNVLFLHEVAYSFDRVRQINACPSGDKFFEERQNCLENINSRNTQILVGFAIRETPQITLEELVQAVVGLNFQFAAGADNYNITAQYKTYPYIVIGPLVKEWWQLAAGIYFQQMISGPVASDLKVKLASFLYEARGLLNWESFPDIDKCTETIFDCDLDKMVKTMLGYVDAKDWQKDKRYPKVLALYKTISELAPKFAEARLVTAQKFNDLTQAIDEKVRPAITAIPYMQDDQKAAQVAEFLNWQEMMLKSLTDGQLRKNMLRSATLNFERKPIPLDYLIP